ncbi:MAG: A/G-specific adenine glycosylase, partial [Bryobacteraceae bacterium]
LSRVTEERGAIESQETKARLRQAAASLLSRAHPGEFNQALMELGATICLPKAPQCLLCPIAPHCLARRGGSQTELPIRAARKPFTEAAGELFVVTRKNKILLWQRPAQSRRLAGFWELPGPVQLPNAIRGDRLGSFRHTIVQTHYLYEVWAAEASRKTPGLEWIALEEISRFPLSTTAKKALALK